MAIPIAGSEKDAKNLLFLSLISSLTFGVLIFLLFNLILSQLSLFGLHLANIDLIMLVPIGVCLGGIFSASQHWAVRSENYSLIGSVRAIQAGACVAVQILLGSFLLSPVGLIFGHLLMPISGILCLFGFFVWRRGHELISDLHIESLFQTFKAFIRFPKFSVLADMANNAGLHLPVVIITIFVSPAEGGFLFLAMRVIGTPISIVSTSVGQVYLAKLKHLEAEKNTKHPTFEICKNILNFILLPLVFAAPFASDGFVFLFGAEWERAGYLLMWLLPFYLFQALSSPISNLLYAQQKQIHLLYLSSFGLVIRTLPLILTAVIAPQNVIYVFLVLAPIYYAVSLTLFLRLSRSHFLKFLSFIF